MKVHYDRRAGSALLASYIPSGTVLSGLLIKKRCG